MAEGEKVEIEIDGQSVEAEDQAPYIDENGRTLVPLRFVGEELDANVDWDREKVIVESGETVAEEDENKYEDLSGSDAKEEESHDSGDVEGWEHGMYDEYDIDNFEDYDGFHQEIDTDNVDIELLNSSVFYHANRIRDENGVDVLDHNAELEDVSNFYSEEMYEEDFFGHYHLYDSDLATPTDRVEKLSDLKDVRIGENLAMTSVEDIGEPTGEKVQQIELTEEELEDVDKHTYSFFGKDVAKNWYLSDGHRENLLHESAEEMGIGTYVFQSEEF